MINVIVGMGDTIINVMDFTLFRGHLLAKNVEETFLLIDGD